MTCLKTKIVLVSRSSKKSFLYFSKDFATLYGFSVTAYEFRLRDPELLSVNR